jgi:hypothetical protein
MALAGVKVIELGAWSAANSVAVRSSVADTKPAAAEGIGPGPLGACILADFGADVITVSR